MQSFSIRILKHATKDLEGLDKTAATQIVRRIRWLSENIETMKPIPLKGNLSGLFKVREGNYRIIFQIVYDERLIIIHKIGHRRDIYRT